MSDDLTNEQYAWLAELPDELDVFIAHREFQDAAEDIEAGKFLFHPIANQILARCSYQTPRVIAIRKLIDERKTLLAQQIAIGNTSIYQI